MAVEREFDWNDEIVQDGPEFILLPEGDYNFEITEFERARHNGSEKLPACNKAIVTLKIQSPQGVATVKHNLFLHTKTEGLLCSFFIAIGHRKHGENLKMDWNKVVGSKGKCKITQRKWKNDNGEENTFNDVKKFYEPDEAGGWKAGQF